MVHFRLFGVGSLFVLEGTLSGAFFLTLFQITMNRLKIFTTLFLFLISANGLCSQTPDELQGYINEWNPDTVSEIAALAGERRITLLGESTHGTSEYYSIRAAISMELIKNHGYNLIVVEGDWTAAWEVNKYVKNLPGAAESAKEALAHFTRWPGWMWNNREVLELVELLREYNDGQENDNKAGFYGMDVYSFWDSIDAVARMTDNLSESAQEYTEKALDCLLRFNRNHENYLRNVRQTGRNCGQDISRSITALEHKDRPSGFDQNEWLFLIQNMRVIRQGELHYRGMLYQGPSSWNERARHFEYTLTNLLDWYGDESKGVAWAHNTHIGDARATDMRHAGMENIGQLARLRHGREGVFAIGFGTYTGTVKAGRQWEGQMQRMDIPNARTGSVEELFFETSSAKFWLDFTIDALNELFSESVPHRAIGVVYQPELDQRNNYVDTVMPERYDAFIFIRETSAVEPL